MKQYTAIPSKADTVEALFDRTAVRDYAYLVPDCPAAKEAFSEMVDVVRANRTNYAHSIRFMKVDQTASRASRLCSILNEDENVIDVAWSGCFVLSLQVMSRDKGVWKAGTELEELRTGQFELLLAPGTQEWSKHGVHGRHFQLSSGKECYRMVLKAHRLVVVNKEKVSKNDTYVLEDKDQVRLGNSSYVFSYAKFAYTANGKLAFYKHMGENPALARGYCLTAPYAPTAKPIVAIGDYRCPPSSFARGGIRRGYSRLE